MKKLILAALALITISAAAHADQVLQDRTHKSFKACTIVNGVALADLKAKGMTGEVIVNAGNQYLAKVEVNGASALLMCDGARQQIILVTK